MSTSYYVRGIKPPDEEWQAKAEAFRACRDAGVEPPKALYEFFEWEDPDPLGVVVDLWGCYGGDNNHAAVTETDDGWEVTLADLPDDVKIVRFVVSC